MMKIIESIKRFFSKEQEFYNIVSLEKNDTSNTYFDDLIDEKIDGIIIKNGVANTTINTIKSSLTTWEKYQNKTPFGKIIGYPLNMSAQKDISEYLSFNKKVVEDFEKKIGEPYSSIILKPLQNLSKNHILQVPKYTDNQNYLFGTIRIMSPNKGGLKAHTGNEFRELQKEKGMHHLEATLNIKNSFSFFTVIQKPDKEGNLELFDLLWENTKEQTKGFNANLRDDSKFEKMSHQTLLLDEGDILVFRGGNIWHRVSPVLGNKDRITLGGFLQKKKTQTKYLFGLNYIS